MENLRAFLKEFGLGGWLLLVATIVWCFAVYGGYRFSVTENIQGFDLLNGRCWFEPCQVDGIQGPEWLYRVVVTPGQDFAGHSGTLLSTSYSPDSSRIVSGGIDGTVRQWDATTGAPVGSPLEGHRGRVRSVSYSPDGSRIVSGGEDGTVRQWDAGDGSPQGPRMEGHGGAVLSVSYSPDGSRIVSGGHDDAVYQWDTEDGGALLVFAERVHRGEVWSVSYSPDGTRIVSGGHDGTVRQWDAEDGTLVGPPLEGHGDLALSVSYSPDGSRIVSGGRDGTVRQWDAGDGTPVGPPLEGHRGEVWSVSYSPDGSRIVSGGRDGTVRQWNSEDGTPLGPPVEELGGQVRSVSYSPDGHQIVSGGYDGRVRQWDVRSLTPPILTWLLLLGVIINSFLSMRIVFAAWHDVSVRRPNVPALVSDGPISDLKQATDAMQEVVTRISDFVRNPNSSAPFTFAVTGQWGSGKSSLMKMVEQMLRDDHIPCIWFNAWHHQNETHLFAALMESIRLNAVVPRSLRRFGSSLEFRGRLIWQRLRTTPTAVALFFTLLLLAVYAVCLLGKQVDLGQIKWQGIFLDVDSLNWKVLFGNSWAFPLPLAFLFLILNSRWNPLKAFGVTPASLARATTAWVQVTRFRDRLSFREQFGHAFGEVCQAFGSRRIVIIIDDLDRCRPEQVVQILEALNFLTSRGDCFVLLGIDESQVEHAVGLYYREIAEETKRESAYGEYGGGEIKNRDASVSGKIGSDEYTARRLYARNYLKKLINLRVPVPVVDDRDLSHLREAG